MPATETELSNHPEPRNRKRAQQCLWCAGEMEQSESGRPRKFCSQSCRQRAYEQRRKLSHTDIPGDSVIYSSQAANELLDGLFELRCAAEDIRTAVEEGEVAASISELTAELVEIARRLEKLRGQSD